MPTSNNDETNTQRREDPNSTSPSRQLAMAVLFSGTGPETFSHQPHNLSHSVLPELVLMDADMSGVNLGWADLSHSNLTGTKMRGARLRQVSFYNANLVRVDFTDADLIDAVLTDADLTSAILTGAKLGHANLAGAHLDGATLDGPEQLMNVNSLRGVRGLPKEIREQLDRTHRYLFKR